MRRLALLGLASMVSVAVACGGSGESSSSGGLPDGGFLPDGGGTLPDGATADGGVCPPAPTKVLEANAGSLDVSGDEVIFIDHDAGEVFLGADVMTKAIRKVKLDGTGDTVLYTAPAKHQNQRREDGGRDRVLPRERAKRVRQRGHDALLDSRRRRHTDRHRQARRPRGGR